MVESGSDQIKEKNMLDTELYIISLSKCSQRTACPAENHRAASRGVLMDKAGMSKGHRGGKTCRVLGES